MLLWSAPKRLDATERNSAIEVQQHKDAEQKSKSTGKELPVPPQSPNVEINIRNTPSGETNGKNHQYEIAKEQEHIDIERSLANFTRYLVYVGIAQAVILLCQAGSSFFSFALTESKDTFWNRVWLIIAGLSLSLSARS